MAMVITGIVVSVLGFILMGLTYFLPAPWRHRVMQRNTNQLQRMVDEGDLGEYGEGAVERFHRAIIQQREEWKGPVPFVRTSVVLIVAGIILVILGAVFE
jgi:uncharacterized membrane protein